MAGVLELDHLEGPFQAEPFCDSPPFPPTASPASPRRCRAGPGGTRGCPAPGGAPWPPAPASPRTIGPQPSLRWHYTGGTGEGAACFRAFARTCTGSHGAHGAPQCRAARSAQAAAPARAARPHRPTTPTAGPAPHTLTACPHRPHTPTACAHRPHTPTLGAARHTATECAHRPHTPTLGPARHPPTAGPPLPAVPARRLRSLRR